VYYYVRSREKGRGRGGEEERETKKQTHRVSPKKKTYNKTVATFSRHVCVCARAKLLGHNSGLKGAHKVNHASSDMLPA
jgi:hypothetical protein